MRHLAALSITAIGGCSLIVDPPSGGPHPEVLINSITVGSQANPSAVFAGDRYFVVWQDESATPPDTDSKAVRGRFVSRSVVPLDTEFLINQTTAGSQDHPQVAQLAGKLLVVWSDASTGSGVVTGRLLDTQGNFLTPEIKIANAGAGAEPDQRVIAGPNNRFFVVWTNGASVLDTDIHAARVDISGTLVDTTPIVINSTTVSNQLEAQPAHGIDDHLLVVWTDEQVGEGGDIRGRLLDANAAPMGPDFIINTTRPMVQQQPYAIALQAGGYLVAWTDGSQTGDDVDGMAVRARLLDGNGNGLGDDFVLNSRTLGDQAHPRLIQLPDGSIFLAFEDGSMLPPDTKGNGVRERRLASDGTPNGTEHEANTYYTDDQEDTALAVDPDGNVLLLWKDGGGSPPDNSDDSVRARLYPPGT
jgi:hypothetical protein